MAKPVENVEVTKEVKPSVEKVIDVLADKASQAHKEFLNLNQEQVNEIVKAMALAGVEAHMSLAKMAVEETGRGIYEDKIIKNMFSTEYIYNSIKYEKTVGVICENEEEEYFEVAEPVGPVAGVTPVTNPTSTTLFKAIIAMKTRNPIIFAFHPSAQKCSAEAARIVRDAAIQAGAPQNCIQWVEEPSIEATQLLMNHPKVALVLATGGAGMVQSAYSTGKPALGVGPGNVPCFVEKTANVKRAATDIILSKSFDNGMICASEQAAIIEAPIYDEMKAFMAASGVYFATAEEIKKIEPVVINIEKGAVNAAVVGQPAYKIAEMAGVTIPKETKVLACEIGGVGSEYPLSREKLSPVLAIIKADNVEHGLQLAEAMLELGGLGHSAALHSTNDDVIKAFSSRMKAGRIIVNAPSTHGAIGDIYNANIPSLTLGCGSYGKNATSSNVTAVNLINKKRVAKRRVNMQWFRVPNRIFFEYGSLQYLEKMEDTSRVFIVTDPFMYKIGYTDKIVNHLNKRRNHVAVEIFSEVEADPSFDTVMRGAEMMKQFKPDVIIALGGGSAMDAAKGMWLFYEHPDADFKAMKQKFMDIRKRVYKFPKLGKSKMVCIPTTSGTGSEVTSFAVITDKKTNTKYPLADYALTPDVAIIDPEFVLTVPKSLTADTGMDVLTHAIEAYVSIMASDYTDGLALKAIELVFKYLPIACKDGSNREAREKMHNASCIAGMAFTNAFLGINHSLAHKLGGEHHIPHGRANAILLPHVIKYNGEANPTKFVSFPKYTHFIAHEKYQQIARHLGLPASTPQEGVNSLANAVVELMKQLDMPLTVAEAGINEKVYLASLDDLAEKAFEDQCTTANPRLPLVSELADLYKKAYYGA